MSRNPRKTAAQTNFSAKFPLFAVVLMIISLIVFPVMFMQEIKQREKPEWFFGWAYGLAWGATIFLFGAAILLLVDKESEEVFYREKTYYAREETDA